MIIFGATVMLELETAESKTETGQNSKYSLLWRLAFGEKESNDDDDDADADVVCCCCCCCCSVVLLLQFGKLTEHGE